MYSVADSNFIKLCPQEDKGMALVLSYGFIFLDIVPHLCQHAGEHSVRSLNGTVPTSPIKSYIVVLAMEVTFC